MSRGTHYPPELRERAVRMVAETTPDHPTEWAAIKSVAEKLGIGSTETVRKWVRRSQVDAGARPGVTSEEQAEIKRLKRENAELRRANEILKASSFFRGGAVRHEAPCRSRGGERPLPLGRRSGLIEAGGSLIRGTPGRVASGPDESGTCRNCQTVRAR